MPRLRLFDVNGLSIITPDNTEGGGKIAEAMEVDGAALLVIEERGEDGGDCAH